jgi:hypothetical protein
LELNAKFFKYYLKDVLCKFDLLSSLPFINNYFNEIAKVV